MLSGGAKMSDQPAPALEEERRMRYKEQECAPGGSPDPHGAQTVTLAEEACFFPA